MKIIFFITCGFFVKNWQCLTLCCSQSIRLIIARCKIKWLCSDKIYDHDVSEKNWLCEEPNTLKPLGQAIKTLTTSKGWLKFLSLSLFKRDHDKKNG